MAAIEFGTALVAAERLTIAFFVAVVFEETYTGLNLQHTAAVEIF